MSNFDINNLFGVKGIVAVITGGGTGLGLCVAKALDANGAKAVYIVGRREEPLKKAASEAVNGSIIPLPGDVTSKSSLSSIAAQVEKEQGYINVLFANSGIIGIEMKKTSLPQDRKPTVKEFKDAMWEPSIEDFTQSYHVNVSGAFYSALAFLELLDAGNKQGNISQKSNVIITTSIAGYSRIPSTGVSYSASKAGTTHLIKFPSEMNALQGEPTKEGALSKDNTPLERAGSEEEFAGTALYVMGKGGAFLSGNIVVVDGGRLGGFPATY